jgi:hypothetical protein
MMILASDRRWEVMSMTHEKMTLQSTCNSLKKPNIFAYKTVPAVTYVVKDN